MNQDEKSWECEPLQKLDLSYNEISEIPHDIQQLTTLHTFQLRHNVLKALPQEFFQLQALVSLDLSNNLLEGPLSPYFGQLVNLRSVNLAQNRLTLLPESMCQLERLESLHVDGNQLVTLPHEFGNLLQLHSLTASNNALAGLPDSFGVLVHLKSLDLQRNQIVELKDVLVHLRNLQFCDLRHNALQTFPTLPRHGCLDQLLMGCNHLTSLPDESLSGVHQSLTVLDLRDNQLQAIPTTVFNQLHKLKTLDLTNNELHDLPTGLGFLQELHHLLVEGNPLRCIRRSAITSGCVSLKNYLRTRATNPTDLDDDGCPSSRRLSWGVAQSGSAKELLAANDPNKHTFVEAASCGSLDLSNQQLDSLPNGFRMASRGYNLVTLLTKLSLSKNLFRSVPKEIGELKGLQCLTMEECQLEAMDDSIALLPQLQVLHLRKNRFTTDSLVSFLKIHGARAAICQGLRELDVSNNLITALPHELTFLRQLDTLLMAYNRLESTLEFPWHQWNQLSAINLADNQLRTLGCIHQVPKLTSLFIENNNLMQIPWELGHCLHLNVLHIHGNPQRSIRLSIVNQGTEAILKYMRNKMPPPPAPTTKQQVAHTANYDHAENQENIAPSLGFASHQQHATTPLYKRDDVFTIPAKPFGALHNTDSVSNNYTISGENNRNVAPPVVVEPPMVLDDAKSKAQASLDQLNKQMAQLESQLENEFAISSAKKFALKKQLAVIRSQKIRVERQLGLRK